MRRKLHVAQVFQDECVPVGGDQESVLDALQRKASCMTGHVAAACVQLTFSEQGGSGGSMFTVHVHMRSLHDGTVYPSGVGKVCSTQPLRRAWAARRRTLMG